MKSFTKQRVARYLARMRNCGLLLILILATSFTGCRSWNKFWASSVPQGISFGNQRLDKLIPGVAFSYVPNVSGVVESWTLTPALPAGLAFNSENGSISGTPGSAFALTYFTITATNIIGSASYVFPLAILSSGDNVWTVISGAPGNYTRGTEGSLIYDLNAGKLVVGGYTRVNLEGEVNPTGGTNDASFFSSYTTDGTRVMTRLLGAAGYNTFTIGARVDGSSNIYMGGSTFGSLDGQPINAASRQMFVSKFDSGGTMQWTRGRNAGASYTEGTALAVDNASNTYSAGYMNGGSLDAITNTANTENAAILVKHDSSGVWQGTRLWSHPSFLASRGVEAYAVTIDGTGNIWVAGESRSDSYCANPVGTLTPAVFKFNSAMTYQSCGSVNATGSNNFIFGIVADGSGNIYAAGYANGTLDAIAAIGTLDAFLIKFDNNGTRIFSCRLGVGGATTKAYAITRSTDDNYYITGETSGNLNGQSKTGTIDMFVAKYDNAGNLQWVKLMGSAGTSAIGKGLTFDNNNTIYVSGQSNGNYDGVTNPAAPNDALIVTRFVR